MPAPEGIMEIKNPFEDKNLPYSASCGVCGAVMGSGMAVKPGLQPLSFGTLSYALNTDESDAIRHTMNAHYVDVYQNRSNHPEHLESDGIVIPPEWNWTWGGRPLPIDQ